MNASALMVAIVIVFAQFIISGNSYYSGSSWQQIDGGLTHVDAGRSGVWGVNSADNIYHRVGTYEKAGAGSHWQQVPGLLKNIAVGHDIVWGVNSGGNIYYRHGISETVPTGGSWVIVAGGLSIITVNSIDNGVYGVNVHGNIYQRSGVSCDNSVGTGWTQIPGGLTYISYGYSGVWGANSNGVGYYLDNSFRSSNVLEQNPHWVGNTALTLRTISSGSNGVLWATATDDNIYEADISCDDTIPVWDNVPGKLRQISVSNYNGEVWGVNADNNIYRRNF